MRRSGPRRERDSRKRSPGIHLGGWIAIGLCAVLTAGVLAAYVKYRPVFDDINQVALAGLGTRPPKFNDSLNILLIGSDSRAGQNGKIGGFTPGQRSDTVMVVHISPGQRGVTVLSFPRDSAVPVLDCPPMPGFPGGQQAVAGSYEQLNSTFSYGGPNCLLHTLEQVTQIHIDDFVQIDFTGFISVIDTLGGVTVCLPYAIRPTSFDRLNLPAGPHLIRGYQALQYWRLREGVGLGSDLQRIQRDQLLMVSLVQKVFSSHVLNSVSKSYGILKGVVQANALTMDTGLTPGRLLSIATGLSGLSMKTIQFVEVPTVPYPPNPNAWVEFDSTQTPGLFQAIIHDAKLPKLKASKTSKKGTKKSGGGTTPALLSASAVSVEVLNGSGTPGVARTAATALTAQGFKVTGTGDAGGFGYSKSVVEYSSAADQAAAATVASRLDNVTVQQVSTIQPGTVTLILGSTFTTIMAAAAKPVTGLSQQYNGYNGTTNICKDNAAAFAALGA